MSTTELVTEDFLPDELFLYVLSFLDVEHNLVVSLVSKRCRRISKDQNLWHRFCTQLVDKHVTLLHDVDNTDHKHTYGMLVGKTPEELFSFLMLKWMLRRTVVSLRDPNFLQFSIILYSDRGAKNEVKQMLRLDTKDSVECGGIYQMAFKPYPNQDFPPVFFFGERGIYTSCDFVAVGRMLEPRETIIMRDVSLMARLPRGSGWHFASVYSHDPNRTPTPVLRLRVFPLSSSQLNKLGVSTTQQRDAGGDHNHRFDTSEDTSWRLRGSTSTVLYNVGEVVDFQVCMKVEELFRAVNPSYFPAQQENGEEEEEDDDE